MNRDRHKRLYDLHSWIGVLVGLFIFVVAFTGSVAVFNTEIQPWENPAQRLSIPETPVEFEPILKEVLAEVRQKGEKITFIRVDIPREDHPYYGTYINYKTTDKKNEYLHRDWNAGTGEIITPREPGLSNWIRNFHRFLMLPATLGRTLVGIAGILMLVSAVTGIFIHGKIIREFFTLRLKRSQRLKWQDSHKVLGIIGLPFSIMISFTGALLGVVSILGPIIALIAFQGNTEALIDKVIGKHEEPTGVIAQMISVDEVMQMRFPNTDKRPSFLLLENYGDKNAHFEIFYEGASKQINRFDVVTISGATGAPIKSARGDNDTGISIASPANRVLNATVPLHYATYGGIWLKWVYAFMGASLCIMIVTGSMLWVERRQHGPEGQKSDRFYNIITRTNIGVFFGFPLATIALFYCDKLYTGVETARIYWTGVTYFTVIFSVLIFVFLRRNDYKSSKHLMILCGALLLALPFLNAITTGATLWNAEGVGERVSNGVDISLLVLGLFTIFSATRIPVKRNAEKKKKPKTPPIIESPVNAE